MNATGNPALSIETIAAKMDQLPSVPDVILKLSQMLKDPDVTAEELGEVIQMDAQLTAQMLRISNSAHYGSSRQITSMKEAVAILGLKALKAQVYAILSHKMLNRPIEGYGLGDGELWDNALTGAVFAKRLSKLFEYEEPDTAFTVSILRDIGKLVMNEFVADQFKDIEKEALKSKKGFQEAEESLIGYSHAQLGEYIAKKWNFPTKLSMCIRYHHSPSAAPKDGFAAGEYKLLGIVHLADALSMMMGSGVGDDGLLYPVDMDFLNEHKFDMTSGSIQVLMMHMMEAQQEVKHMNESIHT
jgi:HD-like signal output (HDOD) protein